MKTAKLTTTETRALALCQAIRETCQTPADSYPVTVEWVKSRTWGSNPRVMHHGGKCTNVSGCGYCKHSTALAEALRWLGDTEDQQHEIGRQGGAGVSSVRGALAAQGWVLEFIAGGKDYDVYSIRRV